MIAYGYSNNFSTSYNAVYWDSLGSGSGVSYNIELSQYDFLHDSATNTYVWSYHIGILLDHYTSDYNNLLYENYSKSVKVTFYWSDIANIASLYFIPYTTPTVQEFDHNDATHYTSDSDSLFHKDAIVTEDKISIYITPDQMQYGTIETFWANLHVDIEYEDQYGNIEIKSHVNYLEYNHQTPLLGDLVSPYGQCTDEDVMALAVCVFEDACADWYPPDGAIADIYGDGFFNAIDVTELSNWLIDNNYDGSCPPYQ